MAKRVAIWVVPTLICAAALAWLHLVIDRPSEQEQILAEIVKLGGQVHTRAYPHPPLVASALSRLGLTVPTHDKVETLCLYGPEITDSWIENYLNRLNELNPPLGWPEGIRSLEISGSKVSDEGLKCVGRLRGLWQLYLYDPRITDEGLKHLATLSGLQCLHVAGARISDVGVMRLRGLSKLTLLELSGTGVSDEGIDKLKQDLPGLAVRKSPVHAEPRPVPTRIRF